MIHAVQCFSDWQRKRLKFGFFVQSRIHSMKTIPQRLEALRTNMAASNIDAFIVPTTDEYLENMSQSRINAWPIFRDSPVQLARSS
jgi:hypothetical protein